MHCKRENGLGCDGHRSLLCLYPSWLIFHYFVLLCLLLELDGTGPELHNSGLLTHVSDLIWLHEGPIPSFKHHVPHPAHVDIRWTRSVKLWNCEIPFSLSLMSATPALSGTSLFIWLYPEITRTIGAPLSSQRRAGLYWAHVTDVSHGILPPTSCSTTSLAVSQ